MKTRFVWLLSILAACSSATQQPAPTLEPSPVPATLAAAVRRPYLGPVVPPAPFQAAIRAGTRTTTGAPGAGYWVNFATYKLTARIATDSKKLDGTAAITYRNNSRDTLTNLHLDLTQNFHRGDAIRNEPAEVTGGVELKRVVVGGTEMRTGEAGPRYQVFGTRLIILPPRPVLPGETVALSIEWSFTIPQAGAGERMGYSRDNLFFLAYWYPQMAVYDDVNGWHPDPFTGTTEFYADFANYDVTVDAPEGWVVMGTGRLENAQQVLAPDVYQRLQRAEQSDQVVNILDASNLSRATARGTNGRLRWHFVADSVRDVAFSMSRQSLWDAQRTPVGDRNGDGSVDYARVDAFYRADARFWRNSARYSAHAISFLSNYIGSPYPWPHMTAVEGADIMGGGMEYPMMTLIGDYNERGDTALYSVTSHEEAHMWFPMLISSDERRYTWMDEGTTAFNENQAERDFWKPSDASHFEVEDQNSYLQVVEAGMEGEIMRQSAYHYSPFAYGVASYDKPASMLTALRTILGEETFMRAYRTYAQRWKYKHPYPWDMWNTFENVSGKDLDWFWQAWYNTTWSLDQAVASVTGNTITIEDRGNATMPTFLTITRQNGEKLTREIPVETWFNATSTTVTVPAGSPIVRVEIDAQRAFPDTDRTNNVWGR
jgi:hypothetical protein